MTKKLNYGLKLKELRKFFVRRIAAIADLHLMSKYSLFPTTFTTKEGNVIKANEGQDKIFESYKQFCNVCDEWEVDTVLVDGDIVHGQNPIERGIGLLSTNMNDQKEIAVDILSLILKGRDSHFVSGSGYHNSTKGNSVEEDICNQLKANGINSNWYGPIANLKVKPFNKIINLTHGGGKAAYYRETIAAREIVYGKVAEVNNKLPKIDVYVHAHFHWWNHIHQARVHHIQLPGWTAYEPVPIFTPNYTRMQPDIGGCLILFDDVGRITVWPFLYDLPHIADVTKDI